MSVFEIPLSNAPQIISAILGGITYQLTLSYKNVAEGGWVMDIADASGNLLVSGIPLVTGVDLLAPYAYLGIAGKLRVQTTSNPDAVPTFDNLGADGKLYWVTTP